MTHLDSRRSTRALSTLTLTTLTLAGLTNLPAQSTTTEDTSGNEKETIRLSIFEVTSKKDSAYVADKSVATTGFAADLQKIPIVINVITEQFLKDTGGVGFNGVANYLSAFTTDQGGMDDGARNTAGVNPTLGAITGGAPIRVRSRGQPINLSQRNGMPMMFGFSTENIDRVEVARGPMSVFIGGSTLGGVMNLVTQKPAWERKGEFTLKVDSNDSFMARVNVTGPLIDRKLAYRVIAQYSDDNTWKNDSESRTRFFNPQITWRPFEKLTARLEFVHRKKDGNTVSHVLQSTQNYQKDYDTPPQELLNIGTTTSLGRAFTVAEYRARIGRAFATWRSDRYTAYGKWVSLGEGESFTAGDSKDGYKTNYFGANNPYLSEYDMIEGDVNLFATEWLEARAVGRWADQHSTTLAFGNPLRRYPDGSTPLSYGYSTKREEKPLTGKIEIVANKDFWGIKNKLLGGWEIAFNQAWSVNPIWDYTKVDSVAGSPNVINTPATLTGANVFAYFDPRVHSIPNYRKLVTWADEVYADGVSAQFYTRSFPEAGYAAYSGSFWKDRITVLAGYRNSIADAHSWTADRNGTRLTTSGITTRQSTQSNTLGLVFEPFPGLNFYASRNVGTDTQTGSLLNAYSTTYNSLVTTEERAANPVPDLEGYGKEAGMKVELFNRRLIGRVGVFDLYRHNTLVVDNERTANDSRNIGTQVDPNTATQNTAQTARVVWNMPLDGNRSAGYEVGFTWMPNNNYTVVLEGSHLWKNKITVSKPASTSATVLMDYMILNGRPLDNTPDDTLRVWQKYAFNSGTFNRAWLGFGIKAQSSFMPAASTSSWGTVIPGSVVYDAAAGYAFKVFKTPVDVQVNVENLTDKLYSAGGNTWSPPRTISFQASTRF